tara:strand:+ start:179 stop:706 length:528 start_codon:yes stop_codon:yes gene_type:complete
LHLYSQGAWLRHEETLWQVEVTGDPNAWMADYLETLRAHGWNAHDPRHASNQGSPRATATLGSRNITVSASTSPDLKNGYAMSQGSSYYSTTLHPSGPDFPDPIDRASDHSTTFLVSHETRFTGQEILDLFEWNEGAWADMIRHLSDRERGLLRDVLVEESDPALQDLAARLADE